MIVFYSAVTDVPPLRSLVEIQQVGHKISDATEWGGAPSTDSLSLPASG